MDEFTPQMIQCQGCHGEFEFSVADQRFFKEKGFENPKRCRKCREERKRSMQERPMHQGMDHLNKRFYR